MADNETHEHTEDCIAHPQLCPSDDLFVDRDDETQSEAQERWAQSADRAADGLRKTAETTDDPTVKQRAAGHAELMERIAKLHRAYA